MKMGIRARVRQLERDLGAEIVIQEGKSHMEQISPKGWSGIGDDNYYEEREVIDQPRIANPDEAKRSAAAQEIRQIYANSKWYQVLLRSRINRLLGR